MVQCHRKTFRNILCFSINLIYFPFFSLSFILIRRWPRFQYRISQMNNYTSKWSCQQRKGWLAAVHNNPSSVFVVYVISTCTLALCVRLLSLQKKKDANKSFVKGRTVKLVRHLVNRIGSVYVGHVVQDGIRVFDFM